jgi:hypothetical protein
MVSYSATFGKPLFSELQTLATPHVPPAAIPLKSTWDCMMGYGHEKHVRYVGSVSYSNDMIILAGNKVNQKSYYYSLKSDI